MSAIAFNMKWKPSFKYARDYGILYEIAYIYVSNITCFLFEHETQRLFVLPRNRCDTIALDETLFQMSFFVFVWYNDSANIYAKQIPWITAPLGMLSQLLLPQLSRLELITKYLVIK